LCSYASICESNMHNAVTDFLRTSYTCLLLVHPGVRRLEDAANGLLSVYGWPCLSVGRELSAVLLSEPPARRSRTARRWMETRLGQMAPGPVLCTEIDTQLVVTWPGGYLGDVLAYAVPGHSHYRTWRKPEVPIVVLE